MQQTKTPPHPLSWQPNLRSTLIWVTLALLIGVMAACGRTRAPEGLPTEVPTLAAVQPATATTAPTATPAPAATNTPLASSEVTATTPVSTSTGTTATNSLTDTTTISSTPAMTTTAPITSIPEVTVTAAVTTGAAVTTTAIVTKSETATTATTVTNTSAVTSSGTSSVVGTGTMTGAAALTATKTMTNPAAPRVFFRQPTTGATIPLTSTVVMSATGLKVEPAGDVHEGAGHFHILVDKDFIPAGDAIPKDATDLHFGKGQLTTTITLTPGIHVLHLQFGNGAHIALAGAQYRDTITVTVQAGAPAQSVHFVTPENGATVTETFDVAMAAAGLIVEPAGAVQANAGHFHILVDKDFVTTGDAIAKDAQDIHYGKGQLKTQLTLTPGKHTLRLQFANGAHIALDGPQYRDEITVTVK